MTGLSKRKFKRRRFEAECRTLHNGQYHMETICELGQGGFLLRICGSQIQVGDQVEVCFILPNGEIIEEKAEIVYRLEPTLDSLYVGACFLNPALGSQNLIQSFVDR